MVALDGSATWEGVEFVALLFVPAAVLYLLVHIGYIARLLGRCWRRLRPVEVVPVGPPLERIVGDLPRIAGLIEALPPQCPYARRQGAILAYDDALGSACRALGVEDTL